jgi:uncharacterized protein Smg (DUF494 family)
MEDFLEKFKDEIIGVQHGFDRIEIKGYIKDFQIDKPFYYFLSKKECLLKNYKEFALERRDALRKHIDAIAEEANCHREHLFSSEREKLDIAKEIVKKNSVKEGLICILSAVEPCYAITVRKNMETGMLERRTEYRKCVHYYFYYNDKDFGIMFVKLQSWIPYTIKIYINGKEYLKRQLEKKGIKYSSYNNSVTWVEDMKSAQEISDKFIEKKWYGVFDNFAKKINIFTKEIEEILGRVAYTWCLESSEYATDILFKDRKTLEQIYPKLVEYASLCQVGENIFTFFGRKVHGNSTGEAVSDRKHYWQQGFRVKFVMNKNSVKMYDKDSVLRIEATVNNSRAFKVRSQGKWLPMGKSISNMYRIAEVSRKCNERYLNSLSVINRDKNLDKEIESLCHTKLIKLSGKNSYCEARPYGGFNLLRDSTCRLFNVLMNGAYFITGFTRKEITNALIRIKAFADTDLNDMKKLLGKVTRLLAKLRAHGLLMKFPKTFKYRVTRKGQEIISRILLFKKMDLIVC